MNILQEIVEYKKSFLVEVQKIRTLAQVRTLAEMPRRKYNFKGALRKPGAVSLIAEIKKASPSAGIICPDFDPISVGDEYHRAGAGALSILTDEKYFMGSLRVLEEVHAANPLPILRKDFTIDEYQIYEACASGAAAILLIVAILTPDEIRRFSELARRLNLDVLVEVHNREELSVALDCGAGIIGINNRDLKAMKSDLRVTEELAPHIPPGIVRVGESGIHTRADVRRLQEAGVDAILVGESLMKSGDITRKIGELLGRPD
ncbi:MAG: indole-3-glycerol phosphate synthase TrpC [Verrucomicrobiae bacterium]|nr:indole-3-glycerol phosphate synthase TrpC [Verrucomicrobiae bacterium]